MAMPLESPITFSNVSKVKWWRRGIFASQTGYVRVLDPRPAKRCSQGASIELRMTT